MMCGDDSCVWLSVRLSFPGRGYQENAKFEIIGANAKILRYLKQCIKKVVHHCKPDSEKIIYYRINLRHGMRRKYCFDWLW